MDGQCPGSGSANTGGQPGRAGCLRGGAQVLELTCEPAKRAPEVGCKHRLKEYSVLWLCVKPLGVLCKN